MAVTAQASGTAQGASGTPTIVVGTAATLVDVAVAGTFTLHVDTVNMAAGDVLELRIYQIILTGGIRRVAYYARYDNVQATDDQIKISVPISNELTDAGSLRFEITQLRGTVRAFPWKVLKYA